MTHIIYEPIKQQGKFIRKKSIEQILQRKKNRGEKSHQARDHERGAVM